MRRRFYQLRVMDFLVRELGLEHDVQALAALPQGLVAAAASPASPLPLSGAERLNFCYDHAILNRILWLLVGCKASHGGSFCQDKCQTVSLSSVHEISWPVDGPMPAIISPL